MTEGGRPERPGDPDGTLVERVRYWLGFALWLLVIAIVAAVVYVITELLELWDMLGGAI